MRLLLALLTRVVVYIVPFNGAQTTFGSGSTILPCRRAVEDVSVLNRNFSYTAMHVNRTLIQH